MSALVICGILTTCAILVSIAMNEAPAFNILMVLFSALGIISLWTSDNKQVEKKEGDQATDEEDKKQN